MRRIGSFASSVGAPLHTPAPTDDWKSGILAWVCRAEEEPVGGRRCANGGEASEATQEAQVGNVGHETD